MKRFKKFLSVVLAFAMVFEMLPTRVINAETTTVSAPEILTGDAAEPAEVVGELPDLRDKNNKHFRMTDGTIVAANYAEAVHF